MSSRDTSCHQEHITLPNPASFQVVEIPHDILASLVEYNNKNTEERINNRGVSGSTNMSSNTSSVASPEVSPGTVPASVNVTSQRSDASPSTSPTSSYQEDRLPPPVQNYLLQDSCLAHNRQAIAQTVILFLMTHAPKTPDEPLKGVLTKGEEVAASCHVNPASFISAVCDILSFAGVVLVAEIKMILGERCAFWESMLYGQTFMEATMYSHRHRDSIGLWSLNGVPFDVQQEGVLSTYHLTILREMFFWSRKIELDEARPKRGVNPSVRDQDLSDWLLEERRQEGSQKPRYLSYYAIPAYDKVKKLEQMRGLVSRLIRKRSAQEPVLLMNHIRSRAEVSGPKVWREFNQLKGLRSVLSREQEIWREYVKGVEDFQGNGAINPASTGFPNSRQYQLLGSHDAPRAPWRGNRADIYPSEIRALPHKARFNKPHDGLKYQPPIPFEH